MKATGEHLQRIRQYFPDLIIDQVEVNSDGLMNDILVINRQRVFRFARDEQWIRECLRKEIRVLNLVREHVEMPVPVFDIQDVDCVSYALLPGQGLSRADILRQAEETQNRLAQQLATFLRQLRSIPMEVLEQHAIPPTNATKTREEYIQLLEDLEDEVLPLADSHVRRIIRQHFEPLLQDRLDLSYEPALTHGDLGQRHILFDPRQGCITGVLDFGVAGVGDPAQDLAVIVNCYGEGFVRRMARFAPEIKRMIDRARFMSGLAEPSWVLRGLRTKDPFWFTPGLGTARDVMPIGSEWSY